MFHQPVDLSAVELDDLIALHGRVQLMTAENERKAARG